MEIIIAINKELKSYVENKYREKLGEIDREISREASNYRKNLKHLYPNEYLLFTKFQRFLKEMEGRGFVISHFFRSIVDKEFEGLFNEFPYPIEKIELLKQKRMDVIEEQDRLIIQLSLSKDFEMINELLCNAGIGFPK